MILTLLLALPLLVGTLCLCVPSRAWAQRLTYAGIIINSIALVFIHKQMMIASGENFWLVEDKIAWIPSWSINFHLGIDSFSFWLLALAQILGLCATTISMPEKKISAYFAALNWALFGVMGLFLAADVFLFFVFWEVALLPIYWILVVNGGDFSLKDSLRFIVLTQISGLLLLIGIIALALLNADATGHFNFDYATLSNSPLPESTQTWLFALFLLSFMIKLPALPFHGWMPSLFAKGPSSTILIAILVKTSIFGLVRFSWPIFPAATVAWAMPIMIVGAITLIYSAVLAFSQSEPKQIIAYGTLSHAGLLLMGIVTEHHAGFFGVLVMMTSSALSTAALLMIFEQRREHAFTNISGLWHSHPRLSVALLVMALASMGFPVFGNFIGEWLILWSIFAENIALAVITSLGIILSAAYSLRLFQRVCLGEKSEHVFTFSDLKFPEMTIIGALAIMLIGLGLAPAVVLENFADPSQQNVYSSLKPDDGAKKIPEVMSP